MNAPRVNIAELVAGMYGTTRWGDRALYHGTKLSALEAISRMGIQPRRAREGNWKQTVESNPNAVYLTNAYPLHFCANALGDDECEKVVIIEVNVEKLDKLQADEDAIEQVLRGKDSLPKHWDMARRTAYYRARAHQYRAEASLGVLGTCGHRGAIDPKHLARVAVIDYEKMLELIVVGGLDPQISILHYGYFREDYIDWLRWLFMTSPEKEPVWMMPRYRQLLDKDIFLQGKIPTIDRQGICIYDNITYALKGELR